MANSRISFTAHYTAQTWHQHGFAGAGQFDTWLGRTMYRGFQLGKLPVRRLLPAQYADFEAYLAGRHRSFGAEIERLQPDCLIEIACGLSARGLQLAHANPDLQVYEYDLPDMVAYKRRQLGDDVPPNYHLQPGNVLTGEGLQPPPNKGRCVIATEGLISYLSPQQKQQAWQQVQRLMNAAESASYLFEEWPRDRIGRGLGEVASFALGLLTGSNRSGQLFESEAQILQALQQAGFGPAQLVTPLLGALDPAPCPWVLFRLDAR